MNRFVNPHMQHQHMVARQTQQPNMQPNMQHVQQNMQPMQQSGPVMLANGMVMLPNGSIVHPNQVNMQPMNPNMMPMQGGMQSNMQQGPMMMPNGMVMMPNGAIVHPSQVQGNMQGNMPSIQPNANRFGGNSNTAITNGLSITSTENDSIGNRYQQTGTIEMQPIQEEYIPQTFTVNVEKNIKFENNTKVVLNSYIEEIKESQLVHSDDKCTLTDCFEEAVECIIESANEEGGKLITVQNFIVSNNFFKSVAQDKFNELILVDDIKSVYKTLKTAFPTLTNKYDINLINTLDTILTDAVNDYVKVNAVTDVNIDSFMNDFNDLLKVIRNNEEELEDNLIAYMDEFIKTIKDNLTVMAGTEETDADDGITSIPESYKLCYVDKFSYELGIGNCYDKFVLVAENPLNLFIQSLSKSVCSKLKTNNFYMITIDRCIVKLMMGVNGNLFIKKIA